jgi:hypothetical protein
MGRDIAMLLIGMAAGVAASLATGLAVRVALLGSTREAGLPLPADGRRPEREREPDREQEIAIALAAVRGSGATR